MKDTWIKIIDPNYVNAEMIGPVGAEVVVTIEDIDERDAFNPKKFGLMGLAVQENQYLTGRVVLNCGDDTATEVDHEVMELLHVSYESAKELLSAHREALDKIAEYLIRKETITGKEFMKIFRAVEQGLKIPEDLNDLQLPGEEAEGGNNSSDKGSGETPSGKEEQSGEPKPEDTGDEVGSEEPKPEDTGEESGDGQDTDGAAPMPEIAWDEVGSDQESDDEETMPEGTGDEVGITANGSAGV